MNQNQKYFAENK